MGDVIGKEQGQMSYDPACEVLARHFLHDSGYPEKFITELAQHIQDQIEDWLQFGNVVEKIEGRKS
jgi:hypothetical protein